jgi:hypothetical protein
VRDDGTATTAMLGPPGFRVVAVSEYAGEVEQAVEPTAEVAGAGLRRGGRGCTTGGRAGCGTSPCLCTPSVGGSRPCWTWCSDGRSVEPGPGLADAVGVQADRALAVLGPGEQCVRRVGRGRHLSELLVCLNLSAAALLVTRPYAVPSMINHSLTPRVDRRRQAG